MVRILEAAVFETAKGDIQNQEVPRLLQAALFKQLRFVTRCEEKIRLLDSKNDGAIIMRINLYKAFFKQFNTILVMAKGTSYIVDQKTKYLDITSIFTLIRACHERYLTFWHLGTPLGCWPVTPDQELHFRWLCFRLSGIVEEQQTFRLLGRLRDVSSVSKELREQEGARRQIFREIKVHPIFSFLDAHTKSQIEKYGSWRIGHQGVMSWTDLARFSPLHSTMGQYEYFIMGLYAHPTFRGIALDGTHNGNNINNDLAYLYSIAAMFICDADDVFPGSDENLTVKELAIILELRDIAIKWLALPPLGDLEAHLE
jgi:hypothetical protein